MNDQQYCVFLVNSTNYAIRGERLLKRANVACKLIPVPRQLASDCGACIRVLRNDREDAERVLLAEGLEIEAVHDI